MTEYYRLTRVSLPPRDSNSFASAALITCGLCGGMIDSCGGPGDGAICLRCAEVVLSGQARTTIVWDKGTK
jgi:hypothetical protein